MKIISVSLALIMAVPAWAAEPAAAPAPSPATVAAADRLLVAMDYENMMSQMTESMIAQMGPATKKAIEAEIGKTLDDELVRRITEVQARFLRSSLTKDPNMRRAIALLYARHFTAPELDRLADLYQEPVMKKWTQVAPALMADMMPLITDMNLARRGDLVEEIKTVVEDYLQEMGESGGS